MVFGCKQPKKKLPITVSIPGVVEREPIKIEVAKEEPIGESTKERSGIVRVKFHRGTSYSVGTGFFVIHRKNKYLLTAGHNAVASNKVTVFRNAGSIDVNILKHKILMKDDLAAFLVETQETCFELDDPKIFNNIPDFGQLYKPGKYNPLEIEMFGYPEEWNFRKIDGQIYQTIFDGKFLVCTGRCASGMSGGPWFNKKTGKIVSVHAVQLCGKSSGGVPLKKIIKLLNEMEK